MLRLPGPRVLTAVRFDALAALVGSALGIMGSPGPATLSLTAAGAAHGVRRSAAYLTGIVAGTWLVLVAVATGITAAVLAAPAVRPVLLVAAAVYILWLAYRIATAAPDPSDGRRGVPPGAGGGLLLGVSNPKAWVAIAAVFAGTRLAAGAWPDAVAKVAVLTVMIVFVNTVWLAAGASLGPLFRDPRRARRVNRALAAMLIAATGLAVVR